MLKKQMIRDDEVLVEVDEKDVKKYLRKGWKLVAKTEEYYESDEYYDDLRKAEKTLSEMLGGTYLERHLHDGTSIKGEENAVGLYTLGDTDISIGIITNGKIGFWFYSDFEDYVPGHKRYPKSWKDRTFDLD